MVGSRDAEGVGDMVATLAALAIAGDVGEVRRAILEHLERRIPFATARATRTWKEIFEAVGVSDTLNVFLPIPGEAPRLLVLIRDGGQRFTEAERDGLGFLLPFLALAEQRGAKPVSQLPITEAQKKIVALLRFGMTNDEIATDLGKSPLTVRNQLTDIYARCGVTNRTELVAMLGGRPGEE